MQIVIPAALALIFLLLYFNFRNVAETMIVMLSDGTGESVMKRIAAPMVGGMPRAPCSRSSSFRQCTPSGRSVWCVRRQISESPPRSRQRASLHRSDLQ